MTRSVMIFRKRVKDSRNGNQSDRISALPDDVLAKIVSFLPIRHVVGTCILSTRWRYLFTSTTCLSFADTSLDFYACGNEVDEIVRASQRFKELVDRALELHGVSGIEKFSLYCDLGYDYSDLNRWVNTALRKGVQELDIICRYPIDRVPVCVFTCVTLIRLRLFSNSFNAKDVEIPLSPRLQKLKILHLSDIKFLDMTSVQRLFSSCELLEELSLHCCMCTAHGHAIYRTRTLKVLTVKRCSFSPGVFVIDAPNLAYLTCSWNDGLKIVPSWSNSSTFVMAELDFHCIVYDGISHESQLRQAKRDRELLKLAAHKTTHLGIDSVKASRTFGEKMLEFHRLSRLKVDECPYDAWKYMISLISKAPQLKTIELNSGFHCCLCPEPGLEDKCPGECYCNSLPFSEMSSLLPFSCQVEVIQVDRFCEHKGPWTLMCHLLENASLLSCLSICLRRHYDYDDVVRIRDQLMMLPRASTDCRIDVIRMRMIS